MKKYGKNLSQKKNNFEMLYKETKSIDKEEQKIPLKDTTNKRKNKIPSSYQNLPSFKKDELTSDDWNISPIQPVSKKKEEKIRKKVSKKKRSIVSPENEDIICFQKKDKIKKK